MANLSIEKDIDKAKKTLISKAKSKGIYENFGQKEVRQLEDKYGYNNQIQAFDNWCMNFDMSQISRYAKGGSIKDIDIQVGKEFILANDEKIKIIRLFDDKNSPEHDWVEFEFRGENKENSVKSLRIFINNWRKKYAEGGNLEKPLSYYKYSTPVVKMAWNGIIQKGTYYSAEDCAIAIQKQCATEKEIEHYAIVTPDMTIHLGHKQYKIRYPQYAEGGNILLKGFKYEIGGL